MSDSPISSSSTEMSGHKYLQHMTLNAQLAMQAVVQMESYASVVYDRLVTLERMLQNVSISSTDGPEGSASSSEADLGSEDC